MAWNTRPASRIVLATGVALTVLSLAACGKAPGGANSNAVDGQQGAPLPNALPLTADATAPAPAPAPVATALPRAARPRFAPPADPRDAYAYADRAYAMDEAYGEAPPDYAFDYGDAAPMAWNSASGALRIVEQVQGGWRTYYYQPGQSWPYYIQDTDYGYGYTDGALSAVYDSRHRLHRLRNDDPLIDFAGRLLYRAEDLRQFAGSAPRRPARVRDWRSASNRLRDYDGRMDAARRDNGDWRDYHSDHDAEQAAYWRDEEARRRPDQDAYRDWSRNGYQGAPPPRDPGLLGEVAGGALAGGLIGALLGDHKKQDRPPQAPPQNGSGPGPGPGPALGPGRVNGVMPAPQGMPPRNGASPAPQAPAVPGRRARFPAPPSPPLLRRPSSRASIPTRPRVGRKPRCGPVRPPARPRPSAHAPSRRRPATPAPPRLIVRRPCAPA
jgi:hypothetical protein